MKSVLHCGPLIISTDASLIEMALYMASTGSVTMLESLEQEELIIYTRNTHLA
jgi:hypothetical protein